MPRRRKKAEPIVWPQEKRWFVLFGDIKVQVLYLRAVDMHNYPITIGEQVRSFNSMTAAKRFALAQIATAKYVLTLQSKGITKLRRGDFK